MRPIILTVLLTNALFCQAQEIPQGLRELVIHAIQPAPDADLTLESITRLPLQQVDERQWLLPAGRYQGNFVIDVPIHLKCAEGAVFSSDGYKNALNLRSPDVILENCRIEDWGSNLTRMDTGIFVERTSRNSVIRNNSLQGPGFGIWVDAAQNLDISNNEVQGDISIRSQDRGNGIHLFASSNAKIRNNRIWHVRDGIYIEAANDNVLEGNRLWDMRYGIHYMFSNRDRVTKNHTTRTRTGYALMVSRQLSMFDNISDHDQNYGILLNYVTYSNIKNNFVTAVQPGVGDNEQHISGTEGKGLFIYNSLFNTISDNQFQNSALGIHLTAGSEDNKIYNNAFINNEQQVKYVATRYQDWSYEGRGNYWSDYLGWDRNDDGIGDVPYEPNDNVDRLLWTYPQARLLMHSPSIELLRLVQRAFPVVKYPGVQDSHPLMRLPQKLQEQSQAYQSMRSNKT